MNIHPHVCFDLDRILERAGRHGDRFDSRNGRRTPCVDFFIDAVTIQIRSKVEIFLVKLLNRRGDFHREPDNLVRNELFLQWSAGLGSVIDDADEIAAVETV